jgi:hypothetical protein
MYEGVAYSALWKLMGWLPAFLLRWRFSKDALISRTRIDVRNRPHAVQINGGEVSEATIWIAINNAGYFPVELDRLTATLYLGGVPVEFFHLDRIMLRPDSTTELHLRGPINPGVLAHYKRTQTNGGMVSVSIGAEFNSKIHNFAVRTGALNDVATRAINI